MRPIGIRDTARRIIAKAALSIMRSDIQEATGSQQLCGGQISGVEAAIHATRSSFEFEESEAVLLVDATNAFNALNRQVALHVSAQLSPQSSSIPTEHQLTCTLTEMSSSHRKEQPRGTL